MSSSPSSRLAGRRLTAVRTGLALVSVLGFGTVATLASWSDSGTQQTNFTAGSVDLKFDGSVSDSPVGLSSLTLSNAKPGTSTFKSIAVNNIGSLPMTYNLGVNTTTTSTTDLATGLQLSVFTGVSSANCAAGTTTGGTALISASTLSSSPTFAAPRTLASISGSDTLCFQVTLPSSASNALMGTNTTASFVFTGSPA
jgi:predicted ribosomally synthesized peptide with SipW-like signal peptide